MISYVLVNHVTSSQELSILPGDASDIARVIEAMVAAMTQQNTTMMQQHEALMQRQAASLEQQQLVMQ